MTSVLLKVAEVATRLNVEPKTVRRYIEKGALVAVKLPSGHWRVPEEALRTFEPPDNASELWR